ncbi:SsgA family sporulation/cell division regulator [Streptomyces sp. NPDC096040]|uniref:SsgA family sporulation/cell division regulator n=1 Tax=Streptomyces sp. NPDC096040 TaxID=3155541 RepID=UPI00332A7A0A
MKSLRTMIRRLSVQLVVTHEMSLPMDMRLRYEPGDPYAVRAVFKAPGSDDTVEWIIGRDLLIDGLKGPAGEGDIRIWPAGESAHCDLFALLTPPDGRALLKGPVQEIKAFLQETEALVPRGTETEHIDVDALLAHLLAAG